MRSGSTPTRSPTANHARQVAIALAAALLVKLEASDVHAVSDGVQGSGSQRLYYPRGKEYFSFGNVTVDSERHRTLNKHRERVPLSAGVPPFEPMGASPTGAADGLPFPFVHQPKSAGTSIRKVGHASRFWPHYHSDQCLIEVFSFKCKTQPA